MVSARATAIEPNDTAAVSNVCLAKRETRMSATSLIVSDADRRCAHPSPWGAGPGSENQTTKAPPAGLGDAERIPNPREARSPTAAGASAVTAKQHRFRFAPASETVRQA